MDALGPYQGALSFWGENMNRFVVMVDAGYLLRQAIEVLSNKQSHARGDLQITDPNGFIDVLVAKARATLDLASKELLRVYWYDGVMANGFTSQQRTLIEVNDVLFRAGTVNGKGQQKGVDSLIVTDLIELTSHRAICDAVLVTGDSDLAVGIELAQRRGVRIAVLGIEDAAAGVRNQQSFEITSRADRVGRLGASDLTPVLRYLPGGASAPMLSHPPARQQHPPSLVTIPAPARPLSPTAGQLSAAEQATIAGLVKVFVAQCATSLTSSIDPTTQRIDPAIDRTLVHHVFTGLGRRLTQLEMHHTRSVFRIEVNAQTP